MIEFQRHLDKAGMRTDRSSLYRNIENLKKLEVIQELSLPKLGKRFQYVLDKKVSHFYICKACGKLNRGNEVLFNRIENALKDVHGFSKANLSIIFYGLCAKCGKPSSKKKYARSN
jgi:Fe2+ or Zn2+ uptake regulation protein